MDFSTRSDASGVEVNLSGRLLFSDNGAFRTILDDLHSHQGKRLTFNLKDLEFIDSAGLGMLLIAKEVAESKNMQIAVSGVRGQVKSMFEVSCFDSVIPVDA